MSRPIQPPPADVHFSDSAIQSAKSFAPRIRPHWTPAAGHYVLDIDHVVEKSSPFQPGVFYIINYPYFMTLLGGVDAFRSQMVWLPTFEQSIALCETLAGGDENWTRSFRTQLLCRGETLTWAYERLDQLLPSLS